MKQRGATPRQTLIVVRRPTWWMVAIQMLVALCLAGCNPGENRNLWHRDFANVHARSGAVARPELTGYWEGDIAMGSIRAKIESDKITLAIRCDSEGKLVAQGSAPISVKQGQPSAMILQNDLQSDAGDVCGFRFYKGNAFAFALEPGGVLKMNFAGTSVSELSKLADLETVK